MFRTDLHNTLVWIPTSVKSKISIFFFSSAIQLQLTTPKISFLDKIDTLSKENIKCILQGNENKTFEKNSLMHKLLNSFQDIDPTLSITLTFWKVIFLAASVHKRDQKILMSFMQKVPKNETFLRNLSAFYIHQNLHPNGYHIVPNPTEPPVSVTIPRLDKIFPNEHLSPEEFTEDWNLDGKIYPLLPFLTFLLMFYSCNEFYLFQPNTKAP